MGFLKNLKNKVTGGAAEVTVEVGVGQRGQPFPIKVHALSKGSGKVSEVYLLVRATESCEFRDDHNNVVSGTHVSFETRIGIAGAMQLEDGKSYEWTGMLELPEDTNPTFEGELIQHVWEVMAGLDMPGNDPDSGWVAIEVE
jgi:hypothetical protein